jgi:hypothetical protein
MKYDLFTTVALAVDVPEKGLQAGDVATVVEHHTRPMGEDGYTLELFDAVGNTFAVVTLPESGLEPLRAGELLSVRLPAGV